LNKLNFIVIVVSIIGVTLGTFTQIGVHAQGTINQSMNASSMEGKDMTITEGPRGVSSQEASALEASRLPLCGSQDVGCVKVDTSCILENRVSCDPIVEKLFDIFPYVVKNNHLSLNNSPFPASELGRNETFFTGFNASEEYDIREGWTPGSTDLFHGFKNYSSDCRGEIRAGETKLCTIENSLFFEPLGPRPFGSE
jgi:hypothetical protein